MGDYFVIHLLLICFFAYCFFCVYWFVGSVCWSVGWLVSCDFFFFGREWVWVVFVRFCVFFLFLKEMD
ncbi:hypothetical protein BZA77DRAFT_318269 [Pyronema omphalodes]|nr:hypothetical protein BZA77DRAFT_318269 [Pyronema omphalodes]